MSKRTDLLTISSGIGGGYVVVKPIVLTAVFNRKSSKWEVSDDIDCIGVSATARHLDYAVATYKRLLKSWYGIVSNPHVPTWYACDAQTERELAIENIKLFRSINCFVTRRDADELMQAMVDWIASNSPDPRAVYDYMSMSRLTPDFWSDPNTDILSGLGAICSA